MVLGPKGPGRVGRRQAHEAIVESIDNGFFVANLQVEDNKTSFCHNNVSPDNQANLDSSGLFLYLEEGNNIRLSVVEGGLHQAVQNILTVEEDGVSAVYRLFI
jgi:hypothetical protein